MLEYPMYPLCRKVQGGDNQQERLCHPELGEGDKESSETIRWTRSEYVAEGR